MRLLGSRKVYLAYLAVLRFLFGLRGENEGIRIMEEDWDHLIVLDACRYDYFERLNELGGRLFRRTSIASTTAEWLKRNFPGYYGDVVYVSANPFVSNVEFQGFKGYEHFFKVEPVWDYGWSEETGTVHPKVVVDSALRIREEHPDKRLIVHFLQPHAPYIGSTRIARSDLGISGGAKEEVINLIWAKVRRGEIPIEKLKRAYEDNLRLVMGEVKRLVEGLSGKIVVTADHGECFGEHGVYGHDWGIYFKELVEVPWLEIKKGERLEAKWEERESGELSDEEKIRRRLKALGYLD